MPIWLQHLLVLAAVAGATIYIVRQAVATLRAGKGGFGSCCAKGCQSQQPGHKTQSTDRVVFLPVESLSRRRK
jgi:hypothetical protein